jgi:hypothetical protein
VGGHKERENEGECGGCILYPYMKIEELNLLKLFKKGERRMREKDGGGKINCKHICKYHNVSPCTTIIC